MIFCHDIFGASAFSMLASAAARAEISHREVASAAAVTPPRAQNPNVGDAQFVGNFESRDAVFPTVADADRLAPAEA